MFGFFRFSSRTTPQAQHIMRPTAFALLVSSLFVSFGLTGGHTVGSEADAPEPTVCLYDRRTTLQKRADGDDGGDGGGGVGVNVGPPFNQICMVGIRSQGLTFCFLRA
jgi:hypothetical protein